MAVLATTISRLDAGIRLGLPAGMLHRMLGTLVQRVVAVSRHENIADDIIVRVADPLAHLDDYVIEQLLVERDDMPTPPRCPRCNGFIPNNITPGESPGALSRWDNVTEICSECGTAEAILQLQGHSIDPRGPLKWVNPPSEAIDVVVSVFGGRVRSVVINGKRVGADVRDYDVRDYNEAELETDEDGEPYAVYGAL